MKNCLKEKLAAGKVALGVQLWFGSPAIAELCGLAGFDWLLIDTEHAPQTPVTVQAQLQAAGNTNTTALVRLPKNDPDLIKLYLDMGTLGIVVPFISTADEAELGARACRYPPVGTRGWGPHRAAGYGLHAETYTAEINDQVMYVPIIETAEAIRNIDAILAVEGVDTFLLGPVDLCISLGVPFQFDHPTYLDAVQKVRAAAHRAGKPAGIPILGSMSDRENVMRQVEAGSQFLLIGGDEPFLASACRQSLDTLTYLRE
ncbi:MAG: 2,4-dihydroxyhept-2-ene-1,7-dioic acid aldolase [Candidatus Latescibacteria bacterium]|nr:2,4-dihydroxyhept-2-ene-1,7-dioic acid aldolase [Candidatus Latescibacterota bacterium]